MLGIRCSACSSSALVESFEFFVNLLLCILDLVIDLWEGKTN